MSQIDTAAIRKHYVYNPAGLPNFTPRQAHESIEILCDALDAERERNAALVAALREARDVINGTSEWRHHPELMERIDALLAAQAEAQGS